MNKRLIMAVPWGLWTLAMLLNAVQIVLLFLGNFQGLLDGLLLMPATLIFLTVGTLVAWRHPHNPLGWILCIGTTLMLLGATARAYGSYTLLVAFGALPGGVWVAWVGSWAGGSAQNLVLLFALLLLPNGRLVGHKWRPVAWLAALVIALQTIDAMLQPGQIDEYLPVNNPLGVKGIAWLPALTGQLTGTTYIVCAVSFVVRFWRARGEERQQLKWIAYAAGLFIFFIVLNVFPLTGLLSASTIQFIGDILFVLIITTFPLSIGIAMLRYRLFDIDVIIRRTLIYGTLTVISAIIYWGSVVVLQSFVRLLTGDTQSEFVTVASTLAIAALFQPLRRRIQAVIDRRFYRRKYDAQKTLHAFSTKMRVQTDLGQLTNDMLQVVEQTLQPAHASVWLREPTMPQAARLSIEMEKKR